MWNNHFITISILPVASVSLWWPITILWHLTRHKSIWPSGYVCISSIKNKTFRERQHARPAQISKCGYLLSLSISCNDPLHSELHHATKFQAVMSFHLPVPSISWNISNFRRKSKNWPSMAILSSYLFQHTVHHPTKLQANSWNP